MTLERQDITEDWYAGNYKEIILHVTRAGSAMDLRNCEVTYSMVSDKGQILFTLNSQAGGIDVTSDGVNGNALIQIPGPYTTPHHGTYRHHATVVDESGQEETVMTGTVNILANYAHRPRKQIKPAYLLGG